MDVVNRIKLIRWTNNRAHTVQSEVEQGIFTPGENVIITPYHRPTITLLENFFLIINIQSYLLSSNLISVFNNVKNIKIVVNNYTNYTPYNFTPGDESPSSTPYCRLCIQSYYVVMRKLSCACEWAHAERLRSWPTIAIGMAHGLYSKT
jgi:hypothetical protein